MNGGDLKMCSNYERSHRVSAIDSENRNRRQRGVTLKRSQSRLKHTTNTQGVETLM